MTAPGTPIDIAYVEIAARTKEFRRDIRKIIDEEVRDLEDEFTDALDEIDKHFKSTAKTADDTLKDIDATIADVVDSLGDVGSVFDVIDTELDDLNASLDAEFDRSFRKFRESWEDIDRRNVAVEALKKMRESVGDLGNGILSMLRGAGAGFVNFVASIPPLLLPIMLILPPLIGLLVSLGAVVTDAAGALSILLAIIAPLVVGFNGFGEALGAVMEKDPKKLAEALKELSPAARFVVREFQGLLPIFKEIGDTVQQALFTPLVGDLTNLVRTISGPLIGGMANVAFTLGEIISDITGILASPAGVQTLALVFETTNEILQTMKPAIGQVFGSMLTLIRASLPFLELLTTLFSDVLTDFAAWIEESARTGELESFFAGAIDSLRFIAGFLGSIIDFFRALFTPETIAGGQIILAILTDMFEQFTAFLETPAGNRFLEDLTILAIAATGALSLLLQVLGFVFASITLFVGEFIRLITGAGDILDEWKERAEQTSKDIVSAIESVPQRLMALGTSFMNAGIHLIESFIGGFRRTGNFISDVAGDIVKGIRGGLNRMIATINAGIANIDAALPFSIGRIPALAEGGVVSARPGGVIAQIGEGNQDEAVAPLDTLKDMIVDAVGAGGQSITFGPGAISVNFSGSVPSEGEARAVGRAVGDGILDKLALRGIRTQVRAA